MEPIDALQDDLEAERERYYEELATKNCWECFCGRVFPNDEKHSPMKPCAECMECENGNE